MKRVVHVSADFPDTVDADKTKVIRSLVDLTADTFHHQVYSLNRKSPSLVQMGWSVLKSGLSPRLDVDETAFSYGTAVTYHAPSRGLFHATMLDQLGHRIASDIAAGPRPDLIIGHKLAVEGIVVRRAAAILGIPYGLSIQGDTDTKILSARPDLKSAFAKVYHDAAIVFPFSPWAQNRVEARLGTRTGRSILLPCPTDFDTPQAPSVGDGGLVSVFHLKNHKRKNLKAMVDAIALLDQRGIAPELTILGGGGPSDWEACRAAIHGAGKVVLGGRVDGASLRARMNGATGFVMPSLRESFGLVFIEALFNGLPIIYPAGTAVDGYLDGLPFAIPVDARDIQALAAAMRRLVVEESDLKRALAEWQSSDDARRFMRARIAGDFAAGMNAAAA